MKKLWEIVVSDKVPADIAKKIKKLLKPHQFVGRVEPCLFCGVDTTWTLNNKNVCPKCSVEYGFLGERWLLGPCEVCQGQGEWATSGDPQHFLCYRHRDEWFYASPPAPELRLIDRKTEPEKWRQTWEEGWAKFVAFMKEKVSV